MKFKSNNLDSITDEMRLGHRIALYAMSVGDKEVASMKASELGKLGSYQAAKASLPEATVTPNGIEFNLA